MQRDGLPDEFDRDREAAEDRAQAASNMPVIRTPADVRKVIAAIRRIQDDDEHAHGLEDDLHVGVLRAIAEGTSLDPKACAREALKTLELDFSRWCA